MGITKRDYAIARKVTSDLAFDVPQDIDDAGCVYWVYGAIPAQIASQRQRPGKTPQDLEILLARAGRFQENIHEGAEEKREWLVELSPKKYGHGKPQDLTTWPDAKIGTLFNKQYDWLNEKMESAKRYKL